MAIQFNNIGSGSVRDGRGTAPATPGSDAPRGNAAANATGESPVQLSEGAKLLQSVAEHLRSVPEVDEGRVESIRSAIAEGRYHVDPARLAQRFLELEGEL